MKDDLIAIVTQGKNKYGSTSKAERIGPNLNLDDFVKPISEAKIQEATKEKDSIVREDVNQELFKAEKSNEKYLSELESRQKQVDLKEEEIKTKLNSFRKFQGEFNKQNQKTLEEKKILIASIKSIQKQINGVDLDEFDKKSNDLRIKIDEIKEKISSKNLEKEKLKEPYFFLQKFILLYPKFESIDVVISDFEKMKEEKITFSSSKLTKTQQNEVYEKELEEVERKYSNLKKHLDDKYLQTKLIAMKSENSKLQHEIYKIKLDQNSSGIDVHSVECKINSLYQRFFQKKYTVNQRSLHKINEIFDFYNEMIKIIEIFQPM